MKSLSFAIILVVTHSFFAFGQSDEKAAIVKVIEDEHLYFCERNYEKWAATYDQTENVLWGNGIGMSMKGWEAMDKAFKEYFAQNPDPAKPRERYEYKVTVTNDRAWVTCLQKNGEGKEGNRMTILIKRDGEWKIAALLFL